MKKGFLLLMTLMLASAFAWAGPVIEASVDALDFGEVNLGYSTFKTFRVTGTDLQGNINLAIEGRYASEYEVSPTTITPEKAANGAVVRVTYKPTSTYSGSVNLVLASESAEDLVIPVTADPKRNPTIYGYNNQRYYSASVGETDSSVEVAYFADAEIPHDPNQPVVRAPFDGVDLDLDLVDIDFWGPLGGNYEVSIEGDDCFDAVIVKSSSIVNTCNVRISYTPQESGSHHAKLNVICPNAGVPLIVVYLNGTADFPAGDANGDGLTAINDLTGMIDAMLTESGLRGAPDMNGDHILTITDITGLIDRLLGDE